MRLPALGLAIALAGCAHVTVETGERIEVRTLGQVEVHATPTRVDVEGGSISNALGNVLSGLFGMLAGFAL